MGTDSWDAGMLGPPSICGLWMLDRTSVPVAAVSLCYTEPVWDHLGQLMSIDQTLMREGRAIREDCCISAKTPTSLAEWVLWLIRYELGSREGNLKGWGRDGDGSLG